jgi:hypothetical protein
VPRVYCAVRISGIAVLISNGVNVFSHIKFHLKPGQLSRYSDWLRAGRPRDQSWGPGRGKFFLLSMSSKPVLGPTQPAIQWLQRALPGVKQPRREADHSPPSSAEVKNCGAVTPLSVSAWHTA